MSGWWPPEVTAVRRRPAYVSIGFDVGPLCFALTVGFGPDRDLRVVLNFAVWKVLFTHNGYTVPGAEKERTVIEDLS